MKQAVVVVCLLVFSGCTIGDIVDNIEDECGAIVAEYAADIEATCIEAAAEAQNQCIAEVNNAIEEIYDSIEMEAEAWLIANGCLSTGPDMWNCSESWVCGS